ncbi:MAG: hypothetical protein KME40_25625 [Komarekiella atlantica HA4396-MV6]|jgi:heat shock protein HtpX|nr:hypothetical protein [Komarekiella atlantica HA4396-MV6]
MGAIIGLVIAALFNFGTWFYSEQAVLAFYDAKPPSRSQAKLPQPMVKLLCRRAKSIEKS